MSAGLPATIAMALLAATMACNVSRAATSSPPGLPAVWSAHTILVPLHDLPKVYSCNQLWYRFRAVLLKIGARPDTVSVLPYDCGTHSPSVQLEFAFPRVLEPSRAQFGELRVADRTVKLEPGEPAPLDAGDCQLVRQTAAELFAALRIRVVSSRLECGSRLPGQPPFQVSLHALEPKTQEPAQLATRDEAQASQQAHASQQKE